MPTDTDAARIAVRINSVMLLEQIVLYAERRKGNCEYGPRGMERAGVRELILIFVSREFKRIADRKKILHEKGEGPGGHWLYH